ncbi:hypothetical protein ACFZAM_32080 [Streptomyces sp. NPDC008079]|uniref:hypothetical protein n=1 Tax=Streptomyces sp. NPDC008079 TaxID=3364806 RepID=UPI0036E7B2A3
MTQTTVDLAPVPRHLPDTHWYAEGAITSISQFETICEHASSMVANGTFRTATPVRDIESGDWWLDLTWMTHDEALVEARLTLCEDRYSQISQIKLFDVPGVAWTILARADRPWRDTWPSPAHLILPKAVRPLKDLVFRTFDPLGVNPISARETTSEQWAALISAFRDEPWATMLLVSGSAHTVVGAPGDPGHRCPPLARILPMATQGRVFQFTFTDAALPSVNEALRALRLPVMQWHSVLVLSTAALPGSRSSEISETKILTSFDAIRDGVMKRWRQSVPTTPLMKVRLASLRQRPVARDESQAVVPAPSRPADEPPVQSPEPVGADEELRRLLEEATAARLKAEDEAKRLRHEADQDRLRYALARAVQDRDDAQRRLEEADALLEEQARRITWLQQQRAATGLPFTEHVPAPSGPSSWGDLVSRAAGLEFVVLSPGIMEPLKALSNAKRTAVWIQRSWDALMLFEAYGRARRDHGEEVMNLHAYLQWPHATAVISKNQIALSESEEVVANQKYFTARVFPVPVEINADGKAYMGAHIRIGGGGRPAPRLHFLDLTGPHGTGRIYVGYIGPHLPTRAS